MDDEPLHIDVADFLGRRIICTEFQWVDHIIRDQHHRYMEGSEDEIIKALQNPQYGMRFRDRDYSNRRVYYKESSTKDYYIKVVVQYENESCTGIGKIVTAFMPDDITDGELPEL